MRTSAKATLRGSAAVAIIQSVVMARSAMTRPIGVVVSVNVVPRVACAVQL